jgi:hypothetical protein
MNGADWRRWMTMQRTKTTQEKRQELEAVLTWLAGEPDDELVAPGEEDERGGHRGRASKRKTLTLMQTLRIRAAPSN